MVYGPKFMVHGLWVRVYGLWIGTQMQVPALNSNGCSGGGSNLVAHVFEGRRALQKTPPLRTLQ